MRKTFLVFMFVMLILINWIMGVKPLLAGFNYFGHIKALERANFKYQVIINAPKDKQPPMVKLLHKDLQECERLIHKALEQDPDSSTYNLKAAAFYITQRRINIADHYLTNCIAKFNGDLTMWSLYFTKGNLLFASGNMRGAKIAFEKAISYYDLFGPAHQSLEKTEHILKNYSGVRVNF